MSERIDKLKARCEAMLAPGEWVLLEAEATIKVGLIRELGTGRAYLTNNRIIWISRWSLVRLPWMPDVLVIKREAIDQVRRVRVFSRGSLILNVGDKEYTFRPGRGPYPLLRDTPETAEEWATALEAKVDDG